ncbi:uncharacterized protein LOC126900386 [Daktulosphaira vitifoliae]|uniref:uncharacterized protein LOC126900386 n=1 Tax=Daktulosphaira vitifoliae TaxID=58002 RepID=UPI0021AAF496|nr:uncharacterized protein LOC126900386 [Daktulosphaira vitifoliae]
MYEVTFATMIHHIVFQTVILAFLYQLNCQPLKSQCEKNAHFLTLVKDIFGPADNLLTDKKLQELLKQNEKDETFLIFRDRNLKDKIWKLGCKNTELSLYIMYYIKFVMTFNEIYQYEDVLNIYSFFWNNTDGYKKFIPPKRIFPMYNETYISETYKSVCKSWKRKYFELWLYTDVIKKNLLLETLIMYTSRVIKSFNIQAHILKIAYLNYNDLINNNSTKHPFDHLKVEKQLKLYASNMQEYFENVKSGMAPVDFIILKIFKFSYE